MLTSRRTLLSFLGAITTQRAFGQPFGQARPGGPFASDGSRHVRHIDAHMHLVGDPQKKFMKAVRACVTQMDECEITKAVVMSPPQAPPGFFDSPDFVSELRPYSNRFSFLGGGGTLNPMLHAHRDPGSVTRDVERNFVALANRLLDEGAAGFGEIAVLHLSLVERHPFEESRARIRCWWHWPGSQTSAKW